MLYRQPTSEPESLIHPLLGFSSFKKKRDVVKVFKAVDGQIFFMLAAKQRLVWFG